MNQAVTEQEWRELKAEALKSPPADPELPDVLLPYQKEAVQRLYSSRFVMFPKSRRVGLTWGLGSGATLIAATARADGGMDVLYVGFNLDMAREWIDVCGMWAKAFDQAAREAEEFVFVDQEPGHEDRSIQAFRIGFASGFEIIALSSKPRSFRGRQGLAIVDEAAFHDDLPGLRKAAMAFLIWGGKVAMVSSHNGADNPFNVLCQEVLSGRQPGSLYQIDFDSALDQGLYRRICLVTGQAWSAEAQEDWRQSIYDFYGQDADEELRAIPARGSGIFLPGALVEAVADPLVPVVRLAHDDQFTFLPELERQVRILAWCEAHLAPMLGLLADDLPTFLGEDFARSGDLTVFWFSQLDRGLTRPCRFSVELRNTPFEQQRQVLWWILDRLPRFQAGSMDATGNGSWLAEVTAQRYGAGRIAQVKISDAWYAAIMPQFKRAFEDRTLTVPADPDVILDHKAIRVVAGVAKVPRDARVGERKGKASRHGDAAIANVMAFHASLQDAVPLEMLRGSDAREAGGSLFGPQRTGGDWGEFTGGDHWRAYDR